MKRRTLRYLVPVAALLAAAGCDYKESFPYQGDELIDFTTDSLYFSFGKEPFSVTEKTMEVGVEIVGSPVSHDRGYRIRIDPLRTTAQAGLHYDALEETRTIPAGASSTTIPVRVHRLELEDETGYTLRLELVGGFPSRCHRRPRRVGLLHQPARPARLVDGTIALAR